MAEIYNSDAPTLPAEIPAVAPLPSVAPLPGKAVYIPYQPNQPTTTTITTGTGSDFIPSLIPALQSGSYVVLLFLGFTAWSSRKLFVDFLTKHIALVDSLKENLDKQIDTAETQMEVLHQLTENNATLARTLENQGRSSVVRVEN
jgi:hypothetical protein